MTVLLVSCGSDKSDAENKAEIAKKREQNRVEQLNQRSPFLDGQNCGTEVIYDWNNASDVCKDMTTVVDAEDCLAEMKGFLEKYPEIYCFGEKNDGTVTTLDEEEILEAMDKLEAIIDSRS